MGRRRPISVDLTGRRPAFRIFAEAQKADRDEFLPMTPDFAQWLQQTFPEAERIGKVFNLDLLKDPPADSVQTRLGGSLPGSARGPAWWSTRPMGSSLPPMTSEGVLPQMGAQGQAGNVAVAHAARRH